MTAFDSPEELKVCPKCGGTHYSVDGPDSPCAPPMMKGPPAFRPAGEYGPVSTASAPSDRVMTEDQARELFRDQCQPGSRGTLERYGEKAAVAAIMAAIAPMAAEPPKDGTQILAEVATDVFDVVSWWGDAWREGGNGMALKHDFKRWWPLSGFATSPTPEPKP